MRAPVQDVRLVLPAWGYRFIRQMLEFCLPTLLAPGNIPALARSLPCTFVLMTTAEDAPLVRGHAAWKRLESVCRAEIVLIEDPAGQGSAMILTREYARAVRDTGAAMLDTCFIFLLADYLVADGSLAAVLGRVRKGASAVLAGNFQAVAETAAPALRPGSGPELELALSPRAMMEWALRHIHPATLSNFVDSGLAHDGAANRLFWRVDERTILGRFYLMHMIAVRPEIADFIIGASCDYSFVPEMCPSGNVVALTDSDEYLVIEMQPRRKLAASMRFGPITPRSLARSLAQWTTADHRLNARHAVVFHGGDLPPSLSAARARSEAFVEATAQELSAPPQPHRGHPYWIRAIVTSSADVARSPAQDGPAGVVEDKQAYLGTSARIVAELRLALLGRPPNVRPWHPLWADLAVLRGAVREHLDGGHSLAIIADIPTALARFVAPGRPVITLEPDRLLGTTADMFQPGNNDVVLLALSPGNLDDATPLLSAARGLLKPSGVLILGVLETLVEEASRLDADALLGLDLAGSGVALQRARYVSAGWLRRRVQKAMLRTARAAMAHPLRNLPFAAPAGAALALLSLACNKAAVRASTGSPPASCSSLVAVLRGASSLAAFEKRGEPSAVASGPAMAGRCLDAAVELVEAASQMRSFATGNRFEPAEIRASLAAVGDGLERPTSGRAPRMRG